MKGKSKTEKHAVEKQRKEGEKNAYVETDISLNIEVNNGMQVGKKKKKKSSTNKKRQNKDRSVVGREMGDVEKDAVEKKRKIKREKTADVETVNKLNIEVDNRIQVGKKIKEKSSANIKRKNKDRSIVGRESRKSEVYFDEKSGQTKKAKKKRKTEGSFVKEVENSSEKGGCADEDEIYVISSGDEDCSKGMKKWIMEYHQSRPGLNVLQQQIDEFITAHEEKLEEERREREARAAEGGWTVVVHHKGRKKTTDSESGVAVGSVAQAAVENKMAKKKRKEVGVDFYRFQKKEAQRNEIMMLQSKFEEDKKRLQQLRAARKFRPY